MKQGPTRGKIQPHVLPAVALFAAAFFVYASALGHDFLLNLDDGNYVVGNEAVRGFTLDHLKDAFTRFYVGNYAPLHILSYMTDYTLWGLRPAGFLFTNVLLHALNGLLFYFILERLSRRKLWGFVAAFIFLFHPVQVESVAWISQRKNLLSMIFFLAAFHCYLSYRTKGPVQGKPFYVASVATFILSLLSKSAAVILPLVLLLFDLCYVKKEDRNRWLEDKIPYGIAAIAVAVVAIISQSPASGGGRVSFYGGTPLYTALTMPTVLVRYLALLFWPAHLSVLYLPPLKTGVDLAVLLSVLLLVLLAVLGWILYSRNKELFFWFGLFFIGFLPVSQIIPLVTLMNDRYLYFPMLGAAAFLSAIALSVTERLVGYRRALAAGALSLLLLFLPWRSWERLKVWRNDVTLWTDTVAKKPDSEDAWYNLGKSYYDAGQKDNALAAYYRALSINPTAKDTLNNIGGIYMEKGELITARPFFTEALSYDPVYFQGLMNLGKNYYLSGEFRDAEATFKRALSLKPRSARVLASLGDVYLSMRVLDVAGEYYQKAVEEGGWNAYLEYKRASLEALRGHADEALMSLETALQMGYRDLENIKTDPTLAMLRPLPSFKRLLKSYFGETVREQ
jgi:tetratricopeptide (TPR) repeat protein